MFNISSNGIIECYRGDDFEVTLFVNKGTELEPMRWSIKDNEDNAVYFSVMEPNRDFNCGIIRKKYDKSSIYLVEPDTSDYTSEEEFFENETITKFFDADGNLVYKKVVDFLIDTSSRTKNESISWYKSPELEEKCFYQERLIINYGLQDEIEKIIYFDHNLEEVFDEDGDLKIKLTAKDTKHLIPGRYYYQLKATYLDYNREVVNTLTPKQQLIILE